MDYTTTHLNVLVRYNASGMVLHVDFDAAYLVLPKARSRIAGCFQLSNHPNNNHAIFLNGSILVVCKHIQHVVSSAEESENAGVFYNFQLAIPIRCMLKALNHPIQKLQLRLITPQQMASFTITSIKNDLNRGT